MTTVYLAGKMGKRMGACDCGAESCHSHCEPEHAHKCGSTYMEENWRYDVIQQIPSIGERVMFAGGYTFGGPWFIDNHNHGLEAEHVASKCLNWVAASDAVFAWVTSLDAHGTLAEIGYAVALKKPVFVAFDRNRFTEDDERELWFIKEMADGGCSIRNPRSGFAVFTHWLNAMRSPRLTCGSRW